MLDINPSKRPSIDELKAHHFFSSINWTSIAARVQPAPVLPRIPPHPASPKTLRISFGTPYNATSAAAVDPMPHFTFTSSRFQDLRYELTRAMVPSVPAERTRFEGWFGWMTRPALKAGMSWTAVASLLWNSRATD